MKKLLGLSVMLVSLQVISAEKTDLLCKGENGQVQISIDDRCLSLTVKKKIVTRGPEYDCPRGPSCSERRISEVIDHNFSTCKINAFKGNLNLKEENLRSGKWLKYTSTAGICLRPGCIDYKIQFSLVDRNYSGHWTLNSLSTSKVGRDFYEINEFYNLADDLKGLTCKKL